VADHFIQTPTGRELTYKSLPLDIKHYNEYLQLDAHQIYGTQLSKLTFDWYNKKMAKRPFIVGRNTFSGFGKFGGK
jgi:alpha-glucosidase (family GH31 glycosyl hydrolase)